MIYKKYNDLVSIIIPSYKRPQETLRAVNSVLSQDYHSIEIIVIDDNGGNSPFQQKTQFALSNLILNFKIIYISHIKNLGGNSARNTGLIAASGNFISLLDSDDEFYFNKISSQIDYFYKLNSIKSNLTALTCNRQIFNSDKLVGESSISGFIDNALSILSLDVDLAAGSTLFFSKNCLGNLQKFDESLIRHQEVDFVVRLLEKNCIYHLSEVLVKIHIDDRSGIPKTRNFIKNKKYFLSKFNCTILSLSKNERDLIFRSHYIEICKIALRNNNFFIAIFYLIMSKPNFSSINKLLNDIYRVLKIKFIN